MKDYYYILGVEKNATPKEIKTAFRKLSLKFHPDKNNGDKYFEERFKDIHEGYEILSDLLKRKKYDNELKNQNTSNTSQNKNPSPEIIEFNVKPRVGKVGDNFTVTWKTINSIETKISLFGKVVNSGEKVIKIKQKYKELSIDLSTYNGDSYTKASIVIIVNENKHDYISELEKKYNKKLKVQEEEMLKKYLSPNDYANYLNQRLQQQADKKLKEEKLLLQNKISLEKINLSKENELIISFDDKIEKFEQKISELFKLKEESIIKRDNILEKIALLIANNNDEFKLDKNPIIKNYLNNLKFHFPSIEIRILYLRELIKYISNKTLDSQFVKKYPDLKKKIVLGKHSTPSLERIINLVKNDNYKIENLTKIVVTYLIEND